MDLFEKLKILSNSAKYDVSCTSSGAAVVNRGRNVQGVCHAFSADGRCVSLLKVLMSNVCSYDCRYCINRRSNDIPRATFTAQELVDLTIQFYRRNYIEGLFLSSAVIGSPDNTMEQMLIVLELLRMQHGFRGYIHAKAIPGADMALVDRMGRLADRISVNIELPSERSLHTLAPDKSKHSILKPMQQLADQIKAGQAVSAKGNRAPSFAPAGQSTQMIIGATPETDAQILHLTQALYRKYSLKRVFFSAYVPVGAHTMLPASDTKPPLLREHRLYQADWLLRFYHFEAKELLDADTQNFSPYFDPKCYWALRHMERFPVNIQTASYDELIRVPGIGIKSARRILSARRMSTLCMEDLKKMGVVCKRAKYFIRCAGRSNGIAVSLKPAEIVRSLLDAAVVEEACEQMSFFSENTSAAYTEKMELCEEAVKCLAQSI